MNQNQASNLFIVKLITWDQILRFVTFRFKMTKKICLDLIHI